MTSTGRLIPVVVTQFVEEAAMLWNLRSVLLEAPHVRIDHLRRLDNRLAAHLDGLHSSGEAAWQQCLSALESPSSARLFVAATEAVRADYHESLQQLFALVQAFPDASRGLISAFGWLSRNYLQNIVARMVSSGDPFDRMVGIAACAVHGVDPGLVSRRLLEDSDVQVFGRSLRTAAELGREELLDASLAALSDERPECRYWAAWSAVLLGERGRALAALRSASVDDGAPPKSRARAFRLALQAMSVTQSHAFLAELRSEPTDVRRLITGSGIVGDPSYVAWLIGQMTNDATARLAGESFTMITGADLAWSDLERLRAESFVESPNDDPEDANVEIDPDESLPWPDVDKVEKWWAANAARFQTGTRYFMGAPVIREHCIDVLKTGYQRQRILAAHYLCLLEPGTPLFNTSAPAWRQQRLLAAM
jgi:uncharacterized protein (TIGR02270 family)